MAYTTINDPEKYFKPLVYTGNLLQHPVEGLNHQSDWLWIKNMDTTNSHNVLDSIRGTDKTLEGPNNNNEEGDTTTRLDSFDSDGFTVETDPSVNGNNNEIVAWSWNCNSGTNESAVAESGDNPGNTRQTNTTAGFSIIKYTGTGANGTIAHGLGAVPTWMVIKNLSDNSGSRDWVSYHEPLGNAKALFFNESDPEYSLTDLFNSTTPTSSVFTVSTNNRVNKDGSTYIAYIFTPIQGYSKFGEYEGNNSAAGPFIYTGFKPAWLMTKRSDASSTSWFIIDNGRSQTNPRDDLLFTHSSNAQTADSSSGEVDFLSNGFRIRGTNSNFNSSGGRVMYMAFAEAPYVNSNGVPANAAF